MKNQFHIGLLLSLSMVAMMLASACENDLDTLLQGGNCGPSCFLPMADLTDADLTGANLTGADLSFALLNRANLTEANLTGANLTAADLEEAAMELAGRIASAAPLAVEAVMAIDRATRHLPLGEAFGHLRSGDLEAYGRMLGSEDAEEGPRAFAEKRNPYWQGA